MVSGRQVDEFFYIEEENKMRTITIGILMLFALVLSSGGGVSSAQEAPEVQMMGPGMMSPSHGTRGFHQASADRPLITFILEHKQELSLSADQVRSLEAIRSNFQQRAAQRVGEIEAGEAELEGLVTQAPVDLTKVEVSVRKIEGLRAALRLERIKAIDEGKSLLNREQQKKLEELLAEVGLRARRWRG